MVQARQAMRAAMTAYMPDGDLAWA